MQKIKTVKLSRSSKVVDFDANQKVPMQLPISDR